MQFSLILRKIILNFSLGIFLLLFAVDLYSQEITGLTSKEFFEQYGNKLHDESILIIDGRTEAMFASERIGNAVNIDADSEDLLEQLEHHLDQPVIVVYCTTIRRTIYIVNKLRGIYEGEIIFIIDGVRGWKQNNLPVNEGEVITLEEAIEEALSNNQELKTSKMMVEVASGAIPFVIYMPLP